MKRRNQKGRESENTIEHRERARRKEEKRRKRKGKRGRELQEPGVQDLLHPRSPPPSSPSSSPAGTSGALMTSHNWVDKGGGGRGKGKGERLPDVA